jgi:Mn2+/Fe2+ NRAMP family transporter
MLPVLHFAASKQVMGRFASSPTLFAVSGVLALVVMSINVMLVIEFIQAPPVMSAEGGEPSRRRPR